MHRCWNVVKLSLPVTSNTPESVLLERGQKLVRDDEGKAESVGDAIARGLAEPRVSQMSARSAASRAAPSRRRACRLARAAVPLPCAWSLTMHTPHIMACDAGGEVS